MEYIKKEDLIENEIYKNSDLDTIFKAHRNKTPSGIGFRISNSQFAKNNYFSGNNTYLIATPEEKHWLNECIKLNKFITFEEAMKTFVFEYVECINDSFWTIIKKGNIYKIDSSGYPIGCYRILFDEKDGGGGQSTINREFDFKPSTKEAYDAQFVIKEPEFVLPEKWCIKVTDETRDIINKLRSKTIYDTPSIKYDYATSVNYAGNNGIYGTEITFKQFKKYVLKEEIIEEKIIEPLPQFKVIETIETITKVENNEGNQFFIGDIVKSSNGVIQTIESFNYNKSKTNIIAFTNKQSTLGNGIGIDKIEHYIESKVKIEDELSFDNKEYELSLNKETLLEKAKRLYPIGTEFHAARGNKIYYKVKSNSEFKENPDGAICIESRGNGTIYYNGNWAEIIK